MIRGLINLRVPLQGLCISALLWPLLGHSTQDYVGSKTCSGCHAEQFQAWHRSHHAQSMQVVDESTVLGDFNRFRFQNGNLIALFYREEGRFLVSMGENEQNLKEYEISYTFGTYPLQQYLIETRNGRFQALEIAWDSRPAEQGGQRWYSLTQHDGGDAPHWNEQDLNWNLMCAECHSTGLDKNFDLQTERYSTRWREINVACEACHGPGESHIRWTEREPTAGEASNPEDNRGLQIRFDERQGVSWQTAPGDRLPTRSRPRTTAREIETCAVCHSLRTQIHEWNSPSESLYDNFTPALIEPPMYYPDGQIQGEVYVYGSFLQSRMYAAGVTCSDCHDPHTAGLRLPGDALCLQCHSAEVYTAREHHFHDSVESAVGCVDCHMPARTYMGVDLRHDHSIRIPRPDLSRDLDTPNACNLCHSDKSTGWAVEQMDKWYGGQPIGFQQFGRLFALGNTGDLSAGPDLRRMAGDGNQPAIVRASAIRLLSRYPGAGTRAVLESLLKDEKPEVRLATLETVNQLGFPDRVMLILPMLEDPFRSIRIKAAASLAGIPDSRLSSAQKKAVSRGIQEYIEVQHFNAERPQAQLNLGNLYTRLKRYPEALETYRKALAIEPELVAGYLNLSQLQSLMGNPDAALEVLERADTLLVDNSALKHNLGLLYVRRKEMSLALGVLSASVKLAPENIHYLYVYALALESQGLLERAIAVLEKGYKLAPANREILNALASYSLRAGDKAQAQRYRAELQSLPQQ